MATLHIEHAITDLETWRGAFDRFAEARAGAGVTASRIFQPIDDPNYIVVHLDFESAEAAARFRGFLEANVWSTCKLSRPCGITHGEGARVRRLTEPPAARQSSSSSNQVSRPKAPSSS